MLMAAKNTEERVGKQLEDDKGPTKNRTSDSLKKSQLTFSQGKSEEGRCLF